VPAREQQRRCRLPPSASVIHAAPVNLHGAGIGGDRRDRRIEWNQHDVVDGHVILPRRIGLALCRQEAASWR
jgi:hypothetical protein